MFHVEHIFNLHIRVCEHESNTPVTFHVEHFAITFHVEHFVESASKRNSSNAIRNFLSASKSVIAFAKRLDLFCEQLSVLLKSSWDVSSQ